MKNKIYLIGIFSLFLFWGCFKDEGNYDYTKLNAPEWKIKGGIEMTFRAGETAKFRSTPYFTWGKDSVQRASEVTYEWKLGNEVLGHEANFDMSTDELIKRLGLATLDGKSIMGSFSIVDKKTGVFYMKTIIVKIVGTIATSDWYVISENGGNTKLSLVKRRWTESGLLMYELKENIYPEVNEGEILGKPLFMAYAEGATNIDPLGALTIVTTSNEYEINCGSIVKVGNLEEIPIQGEIQLRHDSHKKGEENGLQTFVTDAEGRLYRRMLTKNNLGGEFGTTPLVLDSKGYQITMMGQTQMGFFPIPCYDAMNRRVVPILFFDSGSEKWEEWFPGGPGQWIPDGEQFKLSKLCLSEPQVGIDITGCASVWDMPMGTKPLHLWYVKSGGHPFMGGNYPVLGMIYNDVSGKTWLTEFALDPNTGRVRNAPENKNIEFSGGNLSEGTCILTSSFNTYKRDRYILYSTGNQIRFLDRNVQFSDNDYIRLNDPDDKVTYMAWATSVSYVQLVVCTEKGKLLIYDVPYMEPLVSNPKLIKEFDLGGRVVSAKELNNISYNSDKY